MNCTICQYCCANKNIKSYSSWMNLLLYWDISLCSDNVCVCGVILCIQLFTINFYLINYVLVHLLIYLFLLWLFHITQSECWLGEEKQCGQNSEYRQHKGETSINSQHMQCKLLWIYRHIKGHSQAWNTSNTNKAKICEAYQVARSNCEQAQDIKQHEAITKKWENVNSWELQGMLTVMFGGWLQFKSYTTQLGS